MLYIFIGTVSINKGENKWVKIRLGIVGCGQFSRCFVPLFKAHPYVEKIAVTDIIPERRNQFASEFKVEAFSSFEDMLKSDLNAVAIFVQRHLHGPMTIAALKAGKHVYSAVPMATSIEEIEQIVELVKETRLTFSMGETGHYRPCSVFCRNKMRSGEMGDFVYGEAQYNHDMCHFYEHYQFSGGADWKVSDPRCINPFNFNNSFSTGYHVVKVAVWV